MAGGHGYGDDDGELRSVAGGETEERGGGRSRERGRSERGSGTSPWRREEVGEAATAKQEVAGVGARASSTQLLRGEGEEDDWQLGSNRPSTRETVMKTALEVTDAPNLPGENTRCRVHTAHLAFVRAPE